MSGDIPSRAGGGDPSGSPWSSEESRDFLQERISAFAWMVFVLNVAAWAAAWLISFVWMPSALFRDLSLARWHALHLTLALVSLAMWLATRGRALPVAALGVVESVGLFLISVALVGVCFILPLAYRPDLLAVLFLFAMLLYRAAVVPSAPRRTVWIGALAAAPVVLMTYWRYAKGPLPPGSPSPWAYTVYCVFFSVLALLLSATTSRTIYGLRQTIREARRLGPYTLVQKIGEGGMGAVYRAQHALLRRPTAIKILPPERAGEMDLARFEREVQMTSLLTSPHTVSVYDFGRTPDGLFYYAMEYLDGIDLQEIVRGDGPMPSGRVVFVLAQVCEALAEAHRVGLIHRDIKPANILLSERGGRSDVAKIVDFGLVKNLAAASGSDATGENTLLGTPHYMAPEALRSPDRVDARSDIYALGATAYFLLAGAPVFEGSVPDVFAGHLKSDPVAPSARLARPIPPSLEALVLASLSKKPEARPQSAEEFGAALAACRDVPAWTEADAKAWWVSRGAAIRAMRAAGASASSSSTAPTVLVPRASNVPPPTAT